MINRRDDTEWQEEIMVSPDERTWLDTVAAVNKHIQYKIKAVAGENESEYVNSVIMDNTITAPTNFSVVQVDVHCYDLSWGQDHIVGEDGFILERKIEEGEYIQIAVLGGNIESYQDEWGDNRDENTVDYRIKTYVGEEYSSDVYIENEVFHEDDTPSNLQYEKLAINCIALSWEDNSEGEQGFKIDKKVGENEWVENYAFTIEDSTYWIDENAEINQDLQYRVYAYYEEMESASIQTDIIDNTFPTISGLAYEHINIYTIQLNWQDNSNGEQGFKIDKKVGSSNWESEYTIQGENTQTWIDENAEINQDLQYRVYAYFGEMESASIQTEIIDNTIPVPENLFLEIINNNEIRLTWEYELEGITGFRIEKKAEDGIWELYADNITAGSREWEDDNSHIYDSYRIKAFYQEYESEYSNVVSLGLENMIYVEGVTFDMGDHFNEGNVNELPVHDVTLSSFYISKYEVTQGEYEELMGSNPAHDYGVGDDYPVYYVSWYDAVTYCNELSIDVGLTPCYDLSDWSCDFSANGFRLPTEAEWEYAARGGVNWTDNYKYSGTTDDLGDYAWYGNPSGQTHEVGTKEPNQLDIYDMSGNVWEWCNDWYLDSYYSSSPITNPTGPDSGSYRVLRGSGWVQDADFCRVASRNDDPPDDYARNLGLRIVLGSN